MSPGLQSFSPDNPLCVLCHAPAAGRCAGCHAMVCSDCCDVRSGASTPIAYCLPCLDAGAHERHWNALWSLFWPAFLGIGAVVGLIYWLF
jgi:hypothetical protein